VVRINAAVDGAMHDANIIKRFAELGADPPPPGERTPEALGTLVRSEVAKWVPLLRAAGVVAE
jgi:tripartite-type tricarboxylate transporter receptor subunit TctC